MFDFTLLDVWNRPEIQILRAGTKLAVKGISSANAKENSRTAGTPEFMELMDEVRNGNANAQCELALYFAENQDFEQAYYWLNESAEQGNEYALEILDLLQDE